MTIGSCIRVAAAIAVALALPVEGRAPRDRTGSSSGEVVWNIDNLANIGGHRVAVVGNPRVVDTEVGRAIEFDGARDGLFLDVNPLAGLERFSVEALFRPASDGAEEQRFLHFQENGSENRAMMETRLLPMPGSGSPDAGPRPWCLDTFLRHDPASLTLIDRRATHATDRWHVAALVYDGRTMAHLVDGFREAEGVLQFPPIGAGRTSIGVRQNLTYWFRGRIRVVRITPAALPADHLLAVPRKSDGPNVRTSERRSLNCRPLAPFRGQR